MNNVNQVTPYGSVTYNQTGTGPSGVPTYTQTTQLSPSGQAIFDKEGNLVNSALGAAGNLANSINVNPINLNTPASSILNQTPQGLNQQSIDAAYDESKGFLDPQWGQQEKDLQDQLSRQGIPLGSDAYNNAMGQFNNAKTQAYRAASDSAIQSGVNNAATLNNMALQNQALNVNQQIAAQSQPINLLSALISGGQATGQTAAPNAVPAQTGINPTDVAGITQNNYTNQMAAYQAKLAQQNSLWGGLANLGGSLGAAAILA